MDDNASTAEPRASVNDRQPSRWLPIALVFVSFAVFSAVRTPIPAVNEPHYLVKARNFWQPEWCAGDQFLESANPHAAFYATFGWLASTLTFELAACAGRACALLLLAIGWDRLLSRMLEGRWTPLAAAWVFLLLQACGNFAGEWLVGGVESKVVSYALVLWGCGELLAGRRLLAGGLLGGAVSFHPVVGAWCLICLGAAWLLELRGAAFSQFRSDIPVPPMNAPVRIKSDWPAIVTFVICSLPGLIPAVRMLYQPDASLALRADIIQVAIRLDHHLDPYMFPRKAYAYYALLIAAWLFLRRLLPPTARLQRLDVFVGMSIAVAVAGGLAAAGPRPITQLPWLAWRLKLLKLYPFRIADLAIPFALAATLAQVASLRLSSASVHRRTVFACGFAAVFTLALLLPGVDRNPSRMLANRRADWIAALRWIDASAPTRSLLWAADEDWAVKWFAQRPEFVNFKDCPQDAAGLVDWYERRVLLAEWKLAAGKDRVFTPDELTALHASTGITHIIASRLGPVESPPAFENGSFRVYAIAESPGDPNARSPDASARDVDWKPDA